MTLPIPTTDAAMQNVVAFNPANAAVLSIADCYDNNNAFLFMLDRIRCGFKERFRLLHDGFDSVESLVEHF